MRWWQQLLGVPSDMLNGNRRRPRDGNARPWIEELERRTVLSAPATFLSTGVGGDSAVKSLDRARVQGQRQIAALDIGVARRPGGSAQSEVVSVCQHIEYSRALLKV